MLIVVIYHCILFWNGTWFTGAPVFQAKPLVQIAAWMNTFHIYGFTLVSGYIFYHVKCNAGRYGDYWHFLLNKAKRLLIPYVFVIIIWVAPFQYLFFQPSIAELVEKYVLGTSPSQLWFLLMLFGVFAIMWPLSTLLCKHDVIGAAIVFSLYLLSILGSYAIPNVFQVWTACRYCVFFWMGMKMCQYGTEILREIPIWVWVAVDIVLFVVVQSIPTDNMVFKLLRLGLNLLLNMIGALMAFITLGKLSEIVHWKENKVFSCFSKYSFPIYLFHQQLVYCMIWLLNGKINPYVNVLANIVFALAGSLCISWVLMGIKATRVLIGEKA